MQPITFKKIDDLESEDLRKLLSSYLFNPVRGYRLLNRQQLLAYSRCHLKNVLSHRGSFAMAAFQEGHLMGIGVLASAPFETSCLGVKSAKIDGIIVADDRDDKNALRIKQSLTAQLLSLCRRERIRFLSCRVDAQDIGLCQALEQDGFRLMDTILNFILLLTPGGNKIPAGMRRPFEVDFFQEKDRESLLRLVGKNSLKNRFYHDVRIKREKAAGMYEHWIRNLKAIEGTSEILVARRKNEVCGFLAYELNKTLYEATKVRSFGHGLSWVDKDATGAYVQLLGESLQRRDALQADFGEVNTHLFNHAVIRVVQHYGYRLMGSHYTFHRWLRS